MRPSDWISLAALGVAMASVIAGAILAVSQRRASERTARQMQAAQVLGPVMVLLVELDPARWAFTMGPGAEGRARAFRELWEEKVRAQLMAIHASYPTEKERTLALALQVALHNSVVSSTKFGVSSGQDHTFTRDRAQEDWEIAEQLAGDLAAVIRGDRGTKKALIDPL